MSGYTICLAQEGPCGPTGVLFSLRMSAEPAIFSPPPTAEVTAALLARHDARMAQKSSLALAELLADTVYLERMRFEEERPQPEEQQLIDLAARAVARGGADELRAAARTLITAYAEEIHTHFSVPTYRVATSILPRALTTIVTASSPRRLLGGDVDPKQRLRVQGEIEHVRRLSERGTVLITPTHLSNLDSPLIGYAVYACGLPPVAYGAGLNLFTNPVMSFFMRRLGTYIVDRRKQGLLYKDTLKDYSVELLRRGVHSLFFPGGTRSRSGAVEKKLKKGLLGTALRAWQENIAAGQRDRDIFVVPMTLSTSLVLEAETLARDALAREGKSRFIIVDDEFSRTRTVASFLGRVLNLDESVHMTFSRPLDVFGNPVDEEGHSLGPSGERIDRSRYVCDASGAVEWDEQRDHVYTERLAEALVAAFHRDNVALSTHVAAMAAWCLLAARHPGVDTWRTVRLARSEALLPRPELLREIERLLVAISELEQRGKIRAALPAGAEQVLVEAMGRFLSFHTRPALSPDHEAVQADPELVYFYKNRLVGYGLERA